MSAPVPDISIVIPVYNEAGILREAVTSLLEGWAEVRAALREPDLVLEIILAENGSTDRTAELALHLAMEIPEVTSFSLDEPNYGKALRHGIERARGTYVICEEVDLCDLDFHRRALELLRHGDCEFVVGSKAMVGAQDRRPLVRRVATRTMSTLLRLALDFRGTDTHGLKAFRREAVLPVVRQCVVERDLFASELVIRCARHGLALIEIPVQLEEKRPPAINLVRRVPRVLFGLGKLTYVIRLGGASADKR
ncbi:MAG: glycosyltransferase family 2 protein [Myxococcales bacterium]|nr:glycosyltransferase family 2 protein [Myxococcales bacterium]